MKFESGQKMDKRKDELAKTDNIYILRIPYTQKIDEQNIRRIINEHMPKILDNLDAHTAGLGF